MKENWVLRWFTRATGKDYKGKEACPFTRSQSEAVRFPSKVSALLSIDPELRYGAGGDWDECGFKAVRLVPKRAP